MAISFSDFPDLLLVSIADQCLYVREYGRWAEVYPISSAEKGIGNRSGSNQTPLGMHRVCEKYGEGLPIGAVLSSRKFTGELVKISQGTEAGGADLITTRILRLAGEEPGLNQGQDIDSYDRYIYIHGTNEEGRLGKPASHGCIRMANQAIVDLFPRVAIDTPVYIMSDSARPYLNP